MPDNVNTFYMKVDNKTFKLVMSILDEYNTVLSVSGFDILLMYFLLMYKKDINIFIDFDYKVNYLSFGFDREKIGCKINTIYNLRRFIELSLIMSYSLDNYSQITKRTLKATGYADTKFMILRTKD